VSFPFAFINICSTYNLCILDIACIFEMFPEDMVLMLYYDIDVTLQLLDLIERFGSQIL
jgi:hypothetical protein